jgi:hypothetical protein
VRTRKDDAIVSRVIVTIGAQLKPHAVCVHQEPNAPDGTPGSLCDWESPHFVDMLGSARDAAKSHVRQTGHDVAVDVVTRKVYGKIE